MQHKPCGCHSRTTKVRFTSVQTVELSNFPCMPLQLNGDIMGLNLMLPSEVNI